MLSCVSCYMHYFYQLGKVGVLVSSHLQSVVFLLIHVKLKQSCFCWYVNKQVCYVIYAGRLSQLWPPGTPCSKVLGLGLRTSSSSQDPLPCHHGFLVVPEDFLINNLVTYRDILRGRTVMDFFI